MNNKNFNKIKHLKLAVIGLGYVGLPLAVEFGKKRSVIAYDKSNERIKALIKGQDKTLEVKKKEIQKAKFVKFTNKINDLDNANCFIVTVPTPINKKKQPDLKPLIEVSKSLGLLLKKGNIVIYESTVYPGATEEICVPILEKYSRLKYNKDFFCGYSPERINPGDNKHKLKNILKIISGSNKKITAIIDLLYKQIILAGTYKAGNIRTAEAAKIIENTQRDLNIALINELAILFKKMKLDTEDILKAASTKWNFNKFYPGLVGGHCIGVDPYYLTHKAAQIGYKPKIILAGRKLNDGMHIYVFNQFVKEMKKKYINLNKSKILVLGVTFKENCSDARNSKVINLIYKLTLEKCHVDIFDPFIRNINELKIKKNKKSKIRNIKELKRNYYDGIILAVAHDKIKKMGVKFIQSLGKTNHVLYDLKYMFKKKDVSFRL